MMRLLITTLGLLLFFALALQTATAKSPTSDEGMHLLRGKVLWETGDLDLQGQHTPLSHWLIGLFLTTDPDLPEVTSLESWSTKSPEGLVREFVWQSGADVSRLLLLGRLPIIFVGLLIGALLGRWSSRHTGLLGQIIVMTLFAFSPNLLAFSSVATTDVVAAATFLACVLSLRAFWQRPSLLRWFVAAIVLGLALASKLTAVILIPVTLVLCYAHWRNRPWWQPGLVWVAMLPIAGLVLWAVYGFEIGQVDGLSFSIPAPTYLSNFNAVYDHIDRGHYATLLGERSNEGWWYYFGVAFLAKTPAVTVLLLLVTIVFITRHAAWRDTIYLWLPALALFVAASYSRLNIGYRHILPVIPLIWLLIAASSSQWRQRRSFLALLGVLLLIYALGSLGQSPDYLAYFNEFVGGSSQGYRYLGDSNIDWGQDLNQLAEYAEVHDDRPLSISYSGASDPQYYGLEISSLFSEEGDPLNFSPANPSPGRYAISVNHLQDASLAEPDLFDWFRRQEPVDSLGYSILIYDVSSSDSGHWIAQCFDPEPPLEEAAASQYVGREIERYIYFDCRNSWVLPSGSGPGWYVVPEDLDPGHISELLADDLELVFTNRHSVTSPPYKIYYWPAPDEVIVKLLEGSGQVKAAGTGALLPPLQVDDIAKFRGGWSNGSVWSTLWQTDRATDQPVSVLLHLHTGEDQPIVADNLGYPGIQWQPGDLFIQYHDFGGLSGDYLETGLYNYDSGDRLKIDTGDGLVSSIYLIPSD